MPKSNLGRGIIPSTCSFICNAILKFFRRLITCLCSVKFWAFTGKTIGLVGLYHLFSIGLTFYQKWFIKDFPFPLSVVICHLVVKFVLAAQLRMISEWYTGQERITLPWGDYMKKLSIVGFASALDIGLSNWSFRFISISLYTMSKSTCIIFILMFSIILGLETLRLSLVFVVLLISSGLFMYTYSSTEFNLEGFIMVMLASVMGGLRWTVAQLVMQKKEIGLTNPIDMIYHIQPWMIVGLIPLAIPFEGAKLATSSLVFRYHDVTEMFKTVFLAIIGAVLAFLMELSEYLLLVCTSSLTLSISGILKEVFTLYLDVHLNGEAMKAINKIGLVLSVIGISLHVFMRALRSDDKLEPSLSMELTTKPLLQSDSNWEAEDDELEGSEEEIIFDAVHKSV